LKTTGKSKKAGGLKEKSHVRGNLFGPDSKTEQRVAGKKIPPGRGAVQKKKRFKTKSGLNIEPLYKPANLGHQDYFEKIGFPGEFPFTQGAYPIG